MFPNSHCATRSVHEAKPEGETLTSVEEQSAKYVAGVPFGLAAWHFNEWLMDKAKAGVTFTADQLAWLNLIRDHIATSLSIDAEDFEFAPFNQRGGLGKAHQLFGEQLPKLLDELNEVLAA